MTTTEYDLVDYGGSAQFHTAPNLLAGMARMLGASCPPPQRARVLDLGCGNGANLQALAWWWPDSEFVGVDLAATPIAEGQARAQALGLRNLRLIQGDVRALSADQLGRFDFVIAHGLLSWVPPEVAATILPVIASVLSPEGVGYVSYNAYPGCRIRHLARDMLRFHLGGRNHSIDSTRVAAEFASSLGTVPEDQQPPFFGTVQEEAALTLKDGLTQLFHDDLATYNQPYHLHEFAAMARATGLDYLGDVEPRLMLEAAGAPALTRWLDEAGAGDWMRRQQYLDFALGTRFRRSLVRHRDAMPTPRLSADRLADIRYHGEFVPITDCHPTDDSPASFRGPDDQVIQTEQPALKSLLMLLHGRKTRTVGVDELASMTGRPDRREARAAAVTMLDTLVRGALALPMAQDPPSGAPAPPGARGPMLSDLARQCAQDGRMLADRVNRRFRPSQPCLQQLLLAADGQHDLTQLQAMLERLRGQAGDAGSAPELDQGLAAWIRALDQRGIFDARPNANNPTTSDQP